MVVEETPGGSHPDSPRAVQLQNNADGAERFQKRREKSTLILVMIVLIFLICNMYRLSVKLYMVLNPQVLYIDYLLTKYFI